MAIKWDTITFTGKELVFVLTISIVAITGYAKLTGRVDDHEKRIDSSESNQKAITQTLNNINNYIIRQTQKEEDRKEQSNNPNNYVPLNQVKPANK